VGKTFIGALLEGFFGSFATSDFTLQASAVAQSVLPAAQDVFTVEANTLYELRGKYIITTGSTTHTTAMGFVLSGATVNFLEYVVDIHSSALNTITTTVGRVRVTGVTSKVLNATSAALETVIVFEGIISIGTGGTITPQITFSANPTGTNLMKAGSFILFKKIGPSSLVKVGDWA
jgi:hypothetical protein